MKYYIKKISIKITKGVLNAFGYKLIKKENSDTPSETLTFLEGVLEALSISYPALQFLQIGANDGITDDPLYRFIRSHADLGKVVLVEPQPEMCDRLRKNYEQNENVSVINCAVDDEKRNRELYRIKPQYWSRYKGITGSGVSSFDKDYIMKKTKQVPSDLYSHPDEVVEVIRVPCRRLDDLLDNFDNNFVTVLQVDTEGNDDAVIYSLDTENMQPVVINYEYKHLSTDRLDDLHDHLHRNGYNIVRWNKSDEVAILK